MLVPITFDVSGQAFYSRAFEILERQADNLTVPLEDIGGRLITSVGASFEEERAARSGAWAPLSPAYAAFKEQHYPGRPLLVARGDMRADMLNPADSLTVTPRTMLYEPRTPIAIYHQEGTENMPARPMVEIDDIEQREWDRVFIRWLQAGSEAMWGRFL